MKIIDVKAMEILDSRGFPTVSVKMTFDGGFVTVASVPSGASTGSNEALELRDKDPNRYLGKGVLKAVSNVNEVIKPAIINQDFKDVASLDAVLKDLDGTLNKSKLGANAILPVSLAFIKGLALGSGKELYEYFENSDCKMPTCMLNILNGGMHAFNNVDIQEFMIVPQRKRMQEQLRIASEVFHNLKKILEEKGYSSAVGDEGGFAPNLGSNKEALDLIVTAITKAGYKPGEDVALALDVAATSLYQDGKYKIDGKLLDFDELMAYYKMLIDEYPIISIEDPLYEEDFEGFAKMGKMFDIQIVGDDLFTTNPVLLQKGIDMQAANAILIKANQIGSVSETIEAINLAKANNYNIVISHRSGETLDTFIADFAVGLGIPMIKTGSISRGERICKYNRLLEIEEELQNK